MEQFQKDWLLQQMGYDPSQFDVKDDGQIVSKSAAQPAVMSNGLPQPKVKPPGSALGVAAEEAVHSVPGSMAGAAAFMPAMAAAAPLAAVPVIGPALPPLVGIGASMLTGMGVTWGKDAAVEAIAPQYAQERQERVAAHPWAAAGGRLATIPIGGMSANLNNVFNAGRSATALGTAAATGAGIRGIINPVQAANLANVGLGAGLGGGVSAGMQAAQGRSLGEILTSPETLEGVVGGALFNNPNALGQKLYGFKPNPTAGVHANDAVAPEGYAIPTAPVADPSAYVPNQVLPSLPNSQPVRRGISPIETLRAVASTTEPIASETKKGVNISRVQGEQAMFPLLTAEQAKATAVTTRESLQSPEHIAAQGDLARKQHNDRIMREVTQRTEAARLAKAKLDEQAALVDLQKAFTANQGKAPEVRPAPLAETPTGEQIFPDYTGVNEADKTAVANDRVGAEADDIQDKLSRRDQPEEDQLPATVRTELAKAVMTNGANDPMTPFAVEVLNAQAKDRGVDVGTTKEPGSHALTTESLKRMGAFIGTKPGADTRAHEFIGHIFNKMLELSPYKADKRIRAQMLKAAAESPELAAINEARMEANKTRPADKQLNIWDADEFIANQQGLEWLMRSQKVSGETPQRAEVLAWKAQMKSLLNRATPADLRRLVNYKWHNDAVFNDYFKLGTGSATAGTGARAYQKPEDQLPSGYRPVTIKHPDGTTTEAFFNDQYYDMGAMGKFASIAKILPDGKVTHGVTKKGDELIEQPRREQREEDQLPVKAAQVKLAQVRAEINRYIERGHPIPDTLIAERSRLRDLAEKPEKVINHKEIAERIDISRIKLNEHNKYGGFSWDDVKKYTIANLRDQVTPETLAKLETANNFDELAKQLGFQPEGKPGETVVYNSLKHEDTVGGMIPGDAVEIITPAYVHPKTNKIVRAEVRPTNRKNQPQEDQLPGDPKREVSLAAQRERMARVRAEQKEEMAALRGEQPARGTGRPLDTPLSRRTPFGGLTETRMKQLAIDVTKAVGRTTAFIRSKTNKAELFINKDDIAEIFSAVKDDLIRNGIDDKGYFTTVQRRVGELVRARIKQGKTENTVSLDKKVGEGKTEYGDLMAGQKEDAYSGEAVEDVGTVDEGLTVMDTPDRPLDEPIAKVAEEPEVAAAEAKAAKAAREPKVSKLPTSEVQMSRMMQERINEMEADRVELVLEHTEDSPEVEAIDMQISKYKEALAAFNSKATGADTLDLKKFQRRDQKQEDQLPYIKYNSFDQNRDIKSLDEGQSGNYWIAPNGDAIPVRDHTGFAEELQGVQSRRLMGDLYDKMYEKGWSRVVVSNSGMIFVQAGDRPSNAVVRRLKDMAIMHKKEAVIGEDARGKSIYLYQAESSGDGVRYQNTEDQLPASKPSRNLYDNTGPVGRTIRSFVAPEVEKLRALSPAAAEGATDFYQKLRSYRGEFEQTLIRDIKKARDARSVREWIGQDNPDNQAVLKWRDAKQDGEEPGFKLTEDQQKINDAIDVSLKATYDARESREGFGELEGLARGTKQKDFYLPHVMGRKVSVALAENPMGAEAQRYLKEFIDYRTDKARGTARQTVEEARTDWKNIRGQFTLTEDINLAAHFGAVDKAAGRGLPKSLREQHLQDRMARFNRRTARRLAYYDAIQSNKEVNDVFFNQETGISSTPPGRNVIEDIFGIREYDEGTRNAVSGVIRAAMLGPLTGAKDVISGQFLGLQHMDFDQIMPAKLSALRNYRSAYVKAVEKGIIRDNIGAIESGETGSARVQHVLGRIRDITNKVQGRNMLENASRTLNFGEGQYLAVDAFNSLRSGTLTGQKKAFLDDFVPNWREHKTGELPSSVIDEAAARYVESVQGTYDYRGLPSIAMKGSLSPLVSLQRWSIEKFNNFTKHVVNPAANGNYKPMLMSTIGMLIGGAAVNELVELVTQRKARTPNWKEIAQSEEQAELIAYKLAGLASMSGYAGVMGDVAKTIYDYRFGNRVQVWNNPLIEGLTTALEDTAFLVEALAAGDMPAATDVLNMILSDYVQAYRVVQPHVSEKKATEVEEGNKRRDLKVFEMGEGLPQSSSEVRRPNPLLDKDMREFKQTDDMQRAVELAMPLIEAAIKKANGDPEILRAELSKLKRNSYQTVPSPERNPARFSRYSDWMTRTQGSEATEKRITDYMIRNAKNKAKSGMIPSL